MYCFTCQKFFAKGSNHKHDPNDAKKSDDIVNNEAAVEKFANKILTAADEEDKRINAALGKVRKYFYVDLDNSNARCNQCKSPLSEITLSSLIAHRRSHSVENDESESSDDSVEYVELVDHGKRRSLIAQYGKRHYFKLNEGGGKGYCSLCDVHISAHLSVIKQHVRGTRHQGMLFAKRLKNGLHYDNQISSLPTVKPLHVFLKNIRFGNGLIMVCFNDSICVDIDSFLLMLPIGCGKKCLICNELYKCSEINQHRNSDAHMNKVIGAPVMVMDQDAKLANEFIRKVMCKFFY